MSERFLDKVLHLMGIQEEEEDEQAATDEYEKPATRLQTNEEPRRGRVVNLPEKAARGQRLLPASGAGLIATTQGKWRISVMEPGKFEDVQVICDQLKQRRPVLVSVEELDKELSKRIIDFVSGTTYAIDGQVQRVSESIFLFAPNNVLIDADVQHNWEEETE